MTTIVGGQLCPPGLPARGWLALEAGRIEEVGRGEPPSGALDLGDVLLVPGFLDLQVNGVGDVDFAAADRDEWRRAGRFLLKRGTTACCPTLITAPLATYPSRLARIASAGGGELGPAHLGAHLEGPFLGGAPGAHPRDLLRRADPAWLAELLDMPPARIAMVTLAPEADPGFAATSLLASRAIVVALGHSNAAYDEALAAADAGASVVTHLFNGMAPLHHRRPGLVGAALDDERLTPTIIADLVHVHPAALRLAIERKRNVALVTDAVAGASRLADGTLVGSKLTMDGAVRNVVGLGFPVARAVEMATTIPSEILGITDRGRLTPGTRADVVALDTRTLAVRAVWRAGRLVSRR